eukprot:CAMPEP_0185013170 /NCGR_PEP_ID=MMETSP1098-20130426/98671_1 /TAXON_ID=89044 /ORGANISM="Spumella elongata, Strain CCAP 955/1" /LENGTH=413 /DNA_ID=CAMNT_0027542237 /DNA_START=304 /DNA_END=1545 /DNA_ORIENTATION=+
MYFKKHTWIQDVMFFVIWVAKLHGNPWFRREFHLKHHIVSGQIDDAEERLIGLGLPFGLERLAATLHPFGSLIVTPAIARDAKWLDVKRLNLTSAPVAFLFFGLSKLWLLYVFTMLFVGYDQYHHYLPASQWWWIRAAAVLMCLPNILRQSCLVLMSNCSHYYGDIPEKSVLYQNQILDHWMLFPFQLFCVNFGATHIVHHYVPGQPFYIRELVYRRVKELMISKGVRINDFGIVCRANRYYDANSTPSQETDANITKTASSTVLPVDGKLPFTRSVSPNHSHMDQMLMWIGVCCTFGIVSYVVLDQWTELVYRRVKELMISKGVRINDFGIVSRANRYYDANTTPSTVLPADEKLPLTRSVSPNNSHMDQMLLWIGVCCTFGIVSYVVLDQWTTVALGRRIVHKYIYKTKLE